MGTPEKFVVDWNHLFVVISTNNGLVGRDGARKAGPGVLVIDLDEAEANR